MFIKDPETNRRSTFSKKMLTEFSFKWANRWLEKWKSSDHCFHGPPYALCYVNFETYCEKCENMSQRLFSSFLDKGVDREKLIVWSKESKQDFKLDRRKS